MLHYNVSFDKCWRNNFSHTGQSANKPTASSRQSFRAGVGGRLTSIENVAACIMCPSIFSRQTALWCRLSAMASDVFFFPPFLPWGKCIKVKLDTSHQAFKPWIHSRLRHLKHGRANSGLHPVSCAFGSISGRDVRENLYYLRQHNYHDFCCVASSARLRFYLWNLTRPSIRRRFQSPLKLQRIWQPISLLYGLTRWEGQAFALSCSAKQQKKTTTSCKQ